METRKLPAHWHLRSGKIKAQASLNGQMIYRTFDSKEDFLRWVDWIEVKRHRIKANQHSKKIPLGVVFERYLAFKKNLSPGTIKSKRDCIRVIVHLLHVPFDELRLKDIKDAWDKKDKKIGRPSCVKSKRDLIILLKQLDGYAKEETLSNLGVRLSFYPDLLFEFFKIPKKTRKPTTKQFFTQEEIAKVIKHLSTPQFDIHEAEMKDGTFREVIRPKYTSLRQQRALLDIFMLMITTGIRGGELCALKVTDYNKEERSLSINSTICKNELGHEIDRGETKTGRSRVLTNLSKPTIKAIESLIEYSVNEYMVRNLANRGKPFMTTQNVNRWFYSVFENAKVPKLSGHKWGRKNYATWLFHECIENGKNFRETAEALMYDLDHSNILITLKYAQAIYDNIDDEKEQLFSNYESYMGDLDTLGDIDN
jgi:integrase